MCITRSIIKLEFITLDKPIKEAKWIWNFFEDISCWPKLVSTICIYCDSRSAIKGSQSCMYNDKSRHIHHKHNIIKHLLSNRIVSIDSVYLKKYIMDPLTKGLSKEFVYNSSR
jgi:uncharacterized membrane protein